MYVKRLNSGRPSERVVHFPERGRRITTNKTEGSAAVLRWAEFYPINDLLLRRGLQHPRAANHSADPNFNFRALPYTPIPSCKVHRAFPRTNRTTAGAVPCP